MTEFVLWLLGGLGAGAIGGIVTGFVGRSRREAWVVGCLVGFAGAAITLILSSPFGGGLWDLWTGIGATSAGVVGAGVAMLVSRIRRRGAGGQASQPPVHS